MLQNSHYSFKNQLPATILSMFNHHLNKNGMKNIFTLLSCLILMLSTAKAQTTIDPDNTNISYWGRIDFSNAKAPAFEFPGVTIKASFTGTSISMKLHDYATHGTTTTNYYYKIIDGGTPVKFEALAGNNTYVLATGLTNGTHTIEIVKLTEASVGKSAFLGFVLESGKTLQPIAATPTCNIEFIGNSITCGYGNEVSLADPNSAPTFHSINENNFNAWGYVAARSLNMRYKAVSYSGRGLYRNNTGSTTGTLPKIYDRIFPDNSASPTWNHASNHPNVIVLNLGTNDFALDPGTPLNETLFKATYVTFVEQLKTLHPNATIICATGVMMSDYYPAGANHWTRITTYVKDVVATLKNNNVSDVHYFQMSPQSAPYGEDWHPTKATHAAMGAQLATFITNLNITCETTTPPTFSYSISNWLDNKKAAVSLTFDDFSAGHPAIVVPELANRNINGTFNITTSTVSNWNQVKTAFNNGNELANHTKTHKDVTTLTAAIKSDEIRGAKNTIEQQIAGAKVLTLAYPFGTTNDVVIDSVISSKHIGARGVQPSAGNYTYNFAPTERDYYKILTYSMDGTKTISNFTSQIDNIVNGGGFLNYLYHSVYSETVVDNNYAKVHQTDFNQQLDALVNRNTDVWICTFAQAIQYHKEKKTAVLEELEAPFTNGDTWKLQLKDQLANDLYFQALTLNVKIPTGVNNILSIEQNSKNILFKIDGDKLQFNAIPDGGDIIINISGCAVPSINLSDSKLALCTPMNTTISTSNVAGNTYEWFKNGVVLTNEKANTLTITQEGEYTVNVTNNGCTARSSILGKSVTVTNTGVCGNPRANFSIDKNTFLINQSIVLTDKSENVEANAVYTWSFGENVKIVTNNTTASSYTGKGPIEIQYATVGSKTIGLTLSGSAKNNTYTQLVTIIDKVGCILNDDYDDNSTLNFKGGWNNYSFAVANSALKITVPATSPNEWYSFSVLFNDGSNSQLIDFSDAPKKPIIKFRAKASDTLTLKVTLIDNNGIIADGSTLAAKNLFDVTTGYQYFELDMSSLFFNQWDGTTLDSTSISAISFSINAGYTSYPTTNSFGKRVDKPFVGTLEIDWIGVNDDCEHDKIITIGVEDIKNASSIELFPNPTTDKLYLKSNTSNVSWSIMSLKGENVMTGNSELIDISNLDAGIYLFHSNGIVQRVIKL